MPGFFICIAALSCLRLFDQPPVIIEKTDQFPKCTDRVFLDNIPGHMVRIRRALVRLIA